MNQKTQKEGASSVNASPVKLTPPENHIITEADKAVCLGSGEIKPCPLCGRNAISAGRKNEASGYYGYQVICTGLHNCGLSLSACCDTAEEARSTAIEHWNRRTENKTLTDIRETVSRFLVAHRNVTRSWLDGFVECGAVEINFDYHPLYPHIKAKGGAS